MFPVRTRVRHISNSHLVGWTANGIDRNNQGNFGSAFVSDNIIYIAIDWGGQIVRGTGSQTPDNLVKVLDS